MYKKVLSKLHKRTKSYRLHSRIERHISACGILKLLSEILPYLKRIFPHFKKCKTNYSNIHVSSLHIKKHFSISHCRSSSNTQSLPKFRISLGRKQHRTSDLPFWSRGQPSPDILRLGLCSWGQRTRYSEWWWRSADLQSHQQR